MSFSLLFLPFFLVFPAQNNAESFDFEKIFGNLNNFKSDKISKKCEIDLNIWLESLKMMRNVSNQCLYQDDCDQVEKQIRVRHEFSKNQMDSFGKFSIPGSLTKPNVFDGSFNQCSNLKIHNYETNYCFLFLKNGKNADCSRLISFLVPVDVYKFAVCFPATCQPQDITEVFNEIIVLNSTICTTKCSKVEVKKSSFYWFFSFFLCSIIFLAIIATFVDYFRQTMMGIDSRNETNQYVQMLVSFSFWTNAGILLSVKEQKPGYIKSLDFIRFFGMISVLDGHIGHATMSTTSKTIVNERMSAWFTPFLTNGQLITDTFFTISGTVVAFLFFKQTLNDKVIKNPTTWILFYVHRYLRLTPTLMIFIAFFATYSIHIQGPFMALENHILYEQADVCKNYWYQNLFYLQDFGGDNEPCYMESWYLATDTQLYLIAPIFLFAFYFSTKYGLISVAVGTVANIILVYILFFIYDLAVNFTGNGNRRDIYSILFTKPWIRIYTYIIGITTGYILSKYKTVDFFVSRWTILVGWMLAICVGLASLGATYSYDTGSEWSIFTRATYYNFSRIGWALSVSWVIIANHMGWGGPINNFISHPIWQPFGRLSYCAYIVHWMVLMFYMNLTITEQRSLNLVQSAFYYLIPAVSLTYFLAFFWSCLFEIPILKLEGMLLKKIFGSIYQNRKEAVLDDNEKIDKVEVLKADHTKQ